MNILYILKDDNHHFLASFTGRPFKFSFEKHYASATMAEVNPVSALLIIIITLFCESLTPSTSLLYSQPTLIVGYN